MDSLKDNLERMLANGRDDAMLRFGLGSAHFNEKNYAQAIPHLEACIKHDAKYSAAYKLLGKALFKVGKDEESRSVFEAGLPIAIDKGDKQTEREILAFLKKLDRESPNTSR
ncbi:MAG: tetratricopeptide repeat protein [Arenicellales bacterium]|nr:tetratricopeptide repeat protein [Arenicellales bacterium]